MCREDVRFMRKTQTRTTDVAVGVNSVQLLAANPSRICVLLGTINNADYSIAFETPAVLYRGVTLFQQNLPLILDIKDIGQTVTQQINAIASVAGQTIRVTEVIWLDDGKEMKA